MSLLRILQNDRAPRALLPFEDQAPIRPYDISPNKGGPSFLTILSDFTDAFLVEAEMRVGSFIDWWIAFLANGNAEPQRSRGEYALELLTLGILRKEYAAVANVTPAESRRRLCELWRIRSAEPQQKANADRERGRIFLGLLKRACQTNGACDDSRLIHWLAATGEFVQESLRLRSWLEGSSTLWSPEAFVQATAALASWFEHEAKIALGRWTQGVEEFRAKAIAAGEPREDLFLITRSERLYHLNMMGTEVMNRGFRPSWATRTRKIVLVPGCMRAHNDNACQARRDGIDITCTHCDASCEVAALDRLGEERGFRVFVVPHASSFTAWLEHWSKDADTALVAAACPLHLLSGGYEIRALGFDAQCLLLDYSGCKRHWDPVGKPTRLDKKRLLELVDRPFNPC
jgi:hypothetical protein